MQTFKQNALIVSAALLIASCRPTAAPNTPPPNILFIAVDDLNDWVGALNGHPNTLTPNIDRLAASGTLFLNAYTQAPLCGPSRASLMSGLRPSTTGLYGQTDDSDLRNAHPLLQTATFLPEFFGKRGYKTMGIGKLFHQHAPEGVFEVSGGREPGFGPKPPERRYWDRPETSTDWGPFPESDPEMPDYRSADWAVERLRETHDRPFFLGVGFLRPHVPWHVPKQWFDKHPLEKTEVPPYLKGDMDDIPEIGHRVAEVWNMPTTEWAIEQGYWPAIVQAYLASVTFVDAQVGRVLDALEQSGYADNTIIVLFSDHGYHIGEKNRFAKHSLWERATHVPLVFSGKDIRQGQRVASAVELIDIYPTLAALAGFEPEESNEGRSLAPLLSDPNANWPYAAVTTYGRNNHAVVKDNLRYIRYEDGSEEFYDHRTDPNEWHNLAAAATPVPDQRAAMDSMATFLPTINAPWSKLSNIDVYPYFKEQRERSVRGETP
ncbi:MAG: sulfatase [Rhodothermales bacterium]